MGIKAVLNTRDSLGNTPLHSAAWKSNLDMIELLCEAGADENIKDNHGRTPLPIASWYEHKILRVGHGEYPYNERKLRGGGHGDGERY